MYIGEPFSWKPAAFEGSTGIMSVTTKETTGAWARDLHQREPPLLYGGGGGKREQAQRELQILTKIRRNFIMNNNQDYIVRCDRAGVFFGKIKERNGSEVTMTDVRKLWSWDGACAPWSSWRRTAQKHRATAVLP